MSVDPYSPPQSNVNTTEPVAQLVTSTQADRGQRFVAAFLDGLLTFPLWGVLTIVVMKANPLFGGIFTNVLDALTLPVILAVAVVAIAIAAVQLQGFLTRGQSLGKRAVAIKVVRLDGSLPTLQTLFWRTIVWQLIARIPFIGGFIGLADPLAIFGAENLCLHDRLAKTRVVRA